jgi:hypothetical protein
MGDNESGQAGREEGRQVNVLIIGDDRAMCLKALDLADKECDRVRDAQDRLQLEDLNARALQAVFGKIRVALKDAKKRDFDWDFTTRRALGIALLFYKAKINNRREGDVKLLIDPRDIGRKLGELSSLMEALSGQETLFTKSIAWTEPKPPKEKADAGQLDLEQQIEEGTGAADRGKKRPVHRKAPPKTPRA